MATTTEGYWVGWYADAEADPASPSRIRWERSCSHDDYGQCLRLLRQGSPYGRLQSVMVRGAHPGCFDGPRGSRGPYAGGRGGSARVAVLSALRGRWLTRGEILAALGWGESRRSEVKRALATLEAAGEVRRRGPRGAAEYSAAGA